MRQKLLDFAQELRVNSVLSQTPVAGSCVIDGQLWELVALDKWVVDKQMFVYVWMWYMMGNKVYLSLLDMPAVDQQLIDLNPHAQPLLDHPDAKPLIHRVFRNTIKVYDAHKLSIGQKNQLFRQMLDQLKELCVLGLPEAA